ncbi:MAG: hypothetical protein NW933_01035 [Enterobacteriaceae bacterium PSpicST1]|nr:MAG: hypothetical protein NW933_01035 [Enterobacteriaceae bacterium PSpicST1]
MKINKNQQSKIKLLIKNGKKSGYIIYNEIYKLLPLELKCSEKIKYIIKMINNMDIKVLKNKKKKPKKKK